MVSFVGGEKETRKKKIENSKSTKRSEIKTTSRCINVAFVCYLMQLHGFTTKSHWDIRNSTVSR